jgi:hypothetical protein
VPAKFSALEVHYFFRYREKGLVKIKGVGGLTLAAEVQ